MLYAALTTGPHGRLVRPTILQTSMTGPDAQPYYWTTALTWRRDYRPTLESGAPARRLKRVLAERWEAET